MTSRRQSRKIPQAQVRKGFETVVESGDRLRAEALVGLGRMRQIKAATLAREQRRLQAAGAEEDRLTALSKSGARNLAIMQNLRAETRRVKALCEPVPAQGMVINGHVNGRAGVGLPGLTVRLVPVVASKCADYPTTTTDADGYFLLSSANSAERSRIEAVFGRQDGAKQESSRLETRPAKLEVLDESGRVVAAPKAPVRWRPDKADYRVIPIADAAVAAERLEFSSPVRYLADVRTGEVHDLAKETEGCCLSKIGPASRAYFETLEDARRIDYTPCSCCTGGRSRRK